MILKMPRDLWKAFETLCKTKETRQLFTCTLEGKRIEFYAKDISEARESFPGAKNFKPLNVTGK